MSGAASLAWRGATLGIRSGYGPLVAASAAVFAAGLIFTLRQQRRSDFWRTDLPPFRSGLPASFPVAVIPYQGIPAGAVLAVSCPAIGDGDMNTSRTLVTCNTTRYLGFAYESLPIRPYPQSFGRARFGGWGGSIYTPGSDFKAIGGNQYYGPRLPAGWQVWQSTSVGLPAVWYGHADHDTDRAVAPYPLPLTETRNTPRRRRVGYMAWAEVPHDFAEGGRFVGNPSEPARRGRLPLNLVRPGGDEVSGRRFPLVAVSGAAVDDLSETSTAPVPIPVVEKWAASISASGVRSVATVGFSPRASGTKEVKLAFRQASGFARLIGFNMTTEFRDLVESLWKNIPDDAKRFRSKAKLRGGQFRRPGDAHVPFGSGRIAGTSGSALPSFPRMVQDVWNHFEDIQWSPWTEMITSSRWNTRFVHHRGAVLDAALNEVEDRTYGGLGYAARNASRRLGLTAGLQFGGQWGGGVTGGGRVGGGGSVVDWAASLIGV